MPDARSQSRGSLVGVTFEVALVLVALYLLQIGRDGGLQLVLPIVGLGFLLHSRLPIAWRPTFFLALSWLALLVVVGPVWAPAIVAVGLLLIGICHLPILLSLRIVLLALVVGGLAWLRVAGPEANDLPAALSLLASMFMFRLIIYLYDIPHERSPACVATRLSYFFLLPNVCFLIFPIVDYASFRRSYYDTDDIEIYRRGLRRIVRGISHLVLYRWVYHYLTPSLDEVDSLFRLVQIMVSSYAQLLRISGSFHLIVGILGLFGYNLPRPNHFYFLASSFTDYWRRANIYWKDFMVKIFLYPSFMRLRRTNIGQPLFIATLFVFFSTWLLHAWQWFWLLGSVRLILNDVLFWGVFGLAVAVNSVFESRSDAGRRPKASTRSLADGLRHAGRVLAMFAAICLLWSFWTSPSIPAWLELLRAGSTSTPTQLLGLLAGLSVLLLGGALLSRRVAGDFSAAGVSRSLPRIDWLRSAATLGFVLLGATRLAGLGISDSNLLSALTRNDFNQADFDRMEAGYYRDLRAAPRLSSRSWFFVEPPPLAEVVPILRRIEGEVGREILPNLDTVLRGAPFQSNRWGLRDRDYDRAKPEGVYRFAIIGPSDAMGWRVSNEEIFENRLEIRLNAEHAGGRFRGYEVLNFSITELEPLEQLAILRERVARFEPDAVLFILHPADRRRAWRTFEKWKKRGVPLRSELLDFMQIGPSDDPGPRLLELQREGPHVMRFVLQQVEEIARQQGILPFIVVFPQPQPARTAGDIDWLRGLIEESGIPMIDTSSIFEEMGAERFYVSPRDRHPGREAHQEIADRIYAWMVRNDALLKAGLTK